VSGRPRGRSLFWTISGLFLLAVVVGTLLQVLIAVAVLRPLEARETRTRAELAASGLAAEIAATPGPWREPAAHAMLERHRATLGPGPGVIGYRDGSGWRLTDPPDRGRFLDRVLSGAPPDRPSGEHPSSGAPGPRPRERQDVVVVRPVSRGAEQLGEVVVVRPLWPRTGPSFPGSWTVLLFVPITLILSVVVGLLMVRILVRRLRAMETLAARVAEGDLAVRIGDVSGDEIGRLAERLDRMTERLADARDRIAENEQQRRQLFADITHELATPLTSIRGYAETMLDPGVSVSEDERGRYVRGVLEESRRLDRLIRDLFDLARLEAGAAPLAPEALDWAALCRNTIARFEPRFHEAGLRLEWRASPPEVWIEADGHRMEQVLENLLVNALRYVPAGGAVAVALDHPPDRAGRVRLVVSDDGPGLPAEQLAHVFERFYRATGARGSSGARDGGGSGLGLAIVREIVARHGGAVSARAVEPHGLAVEIEMPARTDGPGG
jgi:signal transduction histidine kinase